MPAPADGPVRPYLERKQLGAWYTPAALADRIVAQAAAAVAGPIRYVLDPCAGDGAFLAAAGRHFADQPIERYGVDVDPLAVRTCRQQLPVCKVLLGDSLLAHSCGGIDWNAVFPQAMGQGGFDLVLGNPPWEVLEAAPHQSGAIRLGYATALRASGFRFLAGRTPGAGKINLFRPALERGLDLLRPGGVLAFVVPAGLLRDAGSEPLRRHLLDAHEWLAVWELSTGSELFPTAHRDLACAAIWVRKGGSTRTLVVRQGLGDSDHVVSMPRSFLDDIGPDGAIPALESEAERDLMVRLWRHASLADQVAGIHKGDVNLATDRGRFRATPTALVLRTGKEIGPYQVKAAPQRWIDPAGIAPERVALPRVVWRDIADRTSKKRLVAALLPPMTVLGDTLNCLALAGNPAERSFWLAILNSHVFEWAVRRRSGHNHLGSRVIGPCPAPAFRPTDPLCRAIVALADALSGA
ncbi:MAG: N-6 DNA methylase, partial [Cyanobacteria bacterium REEB65]|nr:N-6 DNA methylase [Cyanobacteria bacterium REEB65]